MGRFSETVMEHFQDPVHRGQVGELDHIGIVGTPGQGPYFIVSLNLDQGIVSDARFECHGCGASVASGSVLTTMILDQSIETCRHLTLEDLL